MVLASKWLKLNNEVHVAHNFRCKHHMKVIILEPYLRGGAYGTGGVPVFSGATPRLKTWIPTDLGLKFMGFLAVLKNFHFEALWRTSKNHNFD